MNIVTRVLCASLLAAAAAAAGATDVGVSVQVSQPGVYGRIDIGRFPQPQVIVAQPVVVTRPTVVVAQPVQPVYLWVPPGPPQALEQTLPRLQRLRRTGLLRAARLVQRPCDGRVEFAWWPGPWQAWQRARQRSRQAVTIDSPQA